MMNKELINKLRQEAWQYANNYAGDDVMPQLQRFEQKFAELIVRESMKVTKDYTCNQGWDYSAPVALARHFGVEE